MAELIGSGRTARMLKEALSLRDQGRAVYVVVPSREMANMLGSDKSYSGIKFETLTSIGVDSFSWEQMRVRGMHHNCDVLVDHAVIERNFSRMLDMLHRFD